MTRTRLFFLTSTLLTSAVCAALPSAAAAGTVGIVSCGSASAAGADTA